MLSPAETIDASFFSTSFWVEETGAFPLPGFAATGVADTDNAKVIAKNSVNPFFILFTLPSVIKKLHAEIDTQ